MHWIQILGSNNIMKMKRYVFHINSVQILCWSVGFWVNLVGPNAKLVCFLFDGGSSEKKGNYLGPFDQLEMDNGYTPRMFGQ